MQTKECHFKCTGGFDINSNFVPHESWNGEIVGFETPSGDMIDLFVGIRVTRKSGEEFYITSTSDMEEFGFFGMEYDETNFYLDEENVVLDEE